MPPHLSHASGQALILTDVGQKKGVVAGLMAASVAGLLYLVSLWTISLPALSVVILMAGRAILGGAESFIITGGVAWGLAKVDKAHAGR
ncbi:MULTISPECIES: hypothetical protein [Erwiniaceae]|uniref:hypothetical protein n=1 Tax=Erwiniaceae TaxID=1903409 RepID=UPI001EEF9C31|nr:MULTISPECIES: hypothetical protein [Erwiniaceae]